MKALRFRRSLAARLALASLALGAAVLLVVATVSYRGAASALDRRLLDRLTSQAEESERALLTWLDRQRAALEHLAELERVHFTRTSRAAPYLLTLPPQLLAATTLVLIEVPGGRVLAATDSSLIGSYEADQLFYQEGRRGTILQPIYPSARTGRPSVTIATPVRADGVTRAVLAAHLDLVALESSLSIPRGSVRVDTYLVNRLAEFVSESRFGIPGYERGVHSQAIDAALRGDLGAGVYEDYRGQRVVGSWRWIAPLEMALILEADHATAIAPARRLLQLTTVLGVIALAVLTLGTLAIARRFTAPVLTLADAAAAVAEGDTAVRVPVAGTDELARLARAFNVMTDRLVGASQGLEEQVRATRTALAEAHANRALLQDVVDSGATLVLVSDAAGAVLLANARLRAILDEAGVGVAPLRLDDIRQTPAAPLLAVLLQAARDQQMVEREVSLTSAGDTHAWQVVAFPIRRGGDGSAATGIIATDLTERARAEEARRAQDAKHQQAQKLESLGIMAGGIAHDFNNLLGAILGNVELAMAADDDPAQRRVSLEQIAAASRRAAELTRQMLAYAGRASLRRETVDIRAVVDDLLPLVRAAQSKKVEFVVELPERPLRVASDPAQLSQVILNLLTNAAEAIGDAAGVVTLRAESVGRAPGGTAAGESWVRIVVSDSGKGIAPDVLDRIFDPFFSTKESGRGLGLSAVRGIVNSLGGTLHVDSELGRGTRFDVRLPAAAESAETPSAVAARLNRRWEGTALIVDDEAALRRVSRIVLEKMGLQVTEAEDGIAGLERFRSAGPDLRLIVLDLTMPGLGGGEVLREVRRVQPTLPVIIASGYDHADAASLFQEDPYLRFLQKPFNLSALQAAVAASLA